MGWRIETALPGKDVREDAAVGARRALNDPVAFYPLCKCLRYMMFGRFTTARKPVSSSRPEIPGPGVAG